MISKIIWRQHEVEELCKEMNRVTNGYVGLTSGYFNPFVHLGHLALLRGCKNWCDFLVVVVNGTESTKRKYGEDTIPVEDRLEYISHIRWVDAVIDYDDDNDNMGQAILDIRPQRFLKGGDRQLKDNTIKTKEIEACKAVGCEIIDGVGGYNKIQSNSAILAEYRERILRSE